MSFAAAASDLLPDLVALRRDLHADPEVGLRCLRTQRRILDELSGLGLEISTGADCTSVVAILRGGRPGPAVLARADMDGLPVRERTGLPFASTNGAMHACGHDLHVAGLIGAARLLAARRDELPGTVVFMFQPGEERVGGARVMLAEGVLDAAGQRVVAAYGVHVQTGAFGEFVTRPGVFMASSNELHVTMIGRGGHGSRPQEAVDPVPALLEFGTALQTLVTRRFSVFDPVVVTVTRLRAGEAINVIGDRASLGATVRALSRVSLNELVDRTHELAAGIASAHGCTATIDFRIDYPVTMNDPQETSFAEDVLGAAFPGRVARASEPMMSSEDFSYVLERVPGCFLFLGCTPPDRDWRAEPWNHAPTVVFDDAILADLATAHAELVWGRLHR